MYDVTIISFLKNFNSRVKANLQKSSFFEIGKNKAILDWEWGLYSAAGDRAEMHHNDKVS